MLLKRIGFSVQKKWEQFRRSKEKSLGGQNKRKNERSWSFYFLQPKNTIICEAQAIKAGFVSNFCKTEWRKKQNGCSSEKERKVNALALRADEGRDNLR